MKTYGCQIERCCSIKFYNNRSYSWWTITKIAWRLSRCNSLSTSTKELYGLSKALQMQGGKNVLLGGVELNCAFCVKPRCEFLRRFYNASRLKVLPQARDASNVCRSTKKIRKYISNFSESRCKHFRTGFKTSILMFALWRSFSEIFCRLEYKIWFDVASVGKGYDGR